jgi:hypothetical protein
MTKMIELSTSIRIQAHRANIERYRSLLASEITRVEREYVMRRIAEERAALRRLEQNAAGASPSPSTGSDLIAEREKRAAKLSWDQRL